MGLPSNSGSHVGIGYQEDGGLHWEESEHRGAVNRNQFHQGHLHGDRETPGGKGSK